MEPKRTFDLDATALNRALVGEWLNGLITRRVPPARWSDALNRQPDDIRVVIDLTR